MRRSVLRNNRGRNLRGFLASCLFLTCLCSTVSAEKSLSDLTGSWQLLVDDWLVAERRGVSRVWHQFEKHSTNPVLKADKPWEGGISYVYGTVLPNEVGPGYRMWYHSWADGEYRKLYATSADGLKWDKPDLGQVDYKGSTRNNLFLRRSHEDHSPQVIHTPDDPDPQRRYKLITYEYGRTPPKYTVSGYLGAYSPDGMQWTESRQYPLFRDPGDVGNFIWDPFYNRYLGYPKKFAEVRGFNRRCIGFTETADFESWPASQLVLIPDEFDDRWVKAPGQHTDFYGMSVFPYESMYLGFLWVFPITDGKNDGPIFVEMTTSRDGVNWQRQDQPRTPVLPVGPAGAWDCGMVFTPNHPLVAGDRLRLYYGGFNSTHGADGKAAVGLATLRKDGFASLEAGSDGGVVVTRPLVGMSGALRLNAAATGGSILAEILDEQGQTLPGYSAQDCQPLTGDSIDQRILWNGSNQLPDSAAPLKLRFILKNAAFYSFHAGDQLRVIQPERGILYTAEGDQGDTVRDRLLADGDQSGRLPGAVTFEADPSPVAFSKAHLRLSETVTDLTTIELPESSQLGTSFTLAAVIKPASKGLSRLFSTYRGSGAPWTSEFIFDIDPSGMAVTGLRAAINGGEVQSGAIKLVAGQAHHVALTYHNGEVQLFLDGDAIRQGTVPGGPVLLGTNLRFGEDLGGVFNEQFQGTADDILYLKRALSPAEVQTLASRGAQAWLEGTKRAAEPVLVARAEMPRPVADRTSGIPDIGSRRELFVDRFLVEKLHHTTFKLHEPRLAPQMSEPADNLEYGTIILDDGLYRLYTRDGREAKFDGDTPEVTRYCESRDGIKWSKPKLGLYEIDGSKENNVILHEAPYCHNFSPFLDRRPQVPQNERFKALAGTVKSGLVAFLSGDGIHWNKLRSAPVITYTKEYAFDSQNVSFWSESEGCYVCYFRHFLDGKLRSVCRTTSADFVTWSEPVALRPNFEGEHLYTTLTSPYFRAPHLYVATPTRFFPSRGESTDILFMTTRGSAPFDRTFREAFIRPGLDPDRWGNRSNYAALSIVPTGPHEMSIYTTPFRRFTLRTDGFASINAGADEGEMITRPFRFVGQRLLVNYSTSAGGSLRVEIQDEQGQPLPGFRLADSRALVGDAIEQPVSWAGGMDVKSVAGKPIRLRFVLREADLYSLQFQALP